MAGLEDIPRKEFFSTPPDYFDKLPSEIQARIHARSGNSWRRPVIKYSLQYALPLLLIAAVLFFFRAEDPNAESILATVESADLVEYLHDSGMTTDDLMEVVDFSVDDLEEIENEVYDGSFSGLDSATIDL